MVRHRVEGGARAAAVALFGRDVLWPDAALARMALGRYVADFALEGEEVDDAEGKIPEHEACEEGALVELRVYPAPDAAESSDDEYHGLGQGKRDKEEAQRKKDESRCRRKLYIGQPMSMGRRETSAFSTAGLVSIGSYVRYSFPQGLEVKRSMTNGETQDQVTLVLAFGRNPPRPVW